MTTVAQLIAARAANQIGPAGCWLLCVLAISGRREWWEDELIGQSGLGSRSSLARVRAECVLAGWLEYTAGAKGRPGLYTILRQIDVESGQNVTSNPDRNRKRRNGKQLRRRQKTQ